MKTKHFLTCGLVAAMVALAGCAGNNTQSIVTVSGRGTVSVEPDMAQMNVSFSRTEQTTRLAQEAIGKIAAQVLAILKDSGIEDKDITTASLRFYPEYEWLPNRSIPLGQRAEQSVDFSIRDIAQDSEKVSRIIDRLSEIDGIMMNRIDFSVADKTEPFVRSRELAFEKAMRKAEQYAALSGRKVGRVLSLSEGGANNSLLPLYGNTRMANQFTMEEAAAYDASSTVLPSGQMEVTTDISVTFALE